MWAQVIVAAGAHRDRTLRAVALSTMLVAAIVIFTTTPGQTERMFGKFAVVVALIVMISALIAASPSGAMDRNVKGSKQ